MTSGREAADASVPAGAFGRGALPKPHARDGDPRSHEQRTISVHALRPGMRLTQDIYDQDGALLLSSGAELTQRFIDLLAKRQIHSVVLMGVDRTRRMHGAFLRKLDALGLRKDEPGDRIPTGDRNLEPEDLAGEAQRGLEAHRRVSGQVAHVASELRDSRSVGLGEVNEAVEDFVGRYMIDRDLLATVLALQESSDEYLFDHSVNVSLLCMILGIHLGLTRDQVMEVGLGALLADIGMLRVPLSIRLAPRTLTALEMEEVRRHPLHTLDCLQSIRSVSAHVAVVGYQGHERCNGSGYPRRRRAIFLHQYARIYGVADTYCAMTHARPYRPAQLPYRATETILVGTSQGVFDRDVVRALLDAVGLFPIGSTVELLDGRRARVIRSTPGLHTKPVVMLLREDNTPSGNVIDLATERDTRVVTALPPASVAAATA